MAFWATKQTRSSLRLRLLFSIIASIVGTVIYELWRSFSDTYSFELNQVLVFFVINLIIFFLISFYSLKMKNAQ
jgi:hypothetical protein